MEPRRARAAFAEEGHGMNKGELRQALLAHPYVVRLRKNPNWQPAADAAIAYFIDNKNDGEAEWGTTRTWARVKSGLRRRAKATRRCLKA
jgi:hypothetical protein